MTGPNVIKSISKIINKFDTLILDCEGAFYNILKDMPEILDNINLIIDQLILNENELVVELAQYNMSINLNINESDLCASSIDIFYILIKCDYFKYIILLYL